MPSFPTPLLTALTPGLAALALLLGAAAPAAPAPAAAVDDGPLPVAQADYQLGGGYPPPEGVTIVVRDSTDAPVARDDVYNICYVNGFQTQPGEKKWWRTNHPELLITTKHGYRVDPNWDDEYILNTSTKSKRTAIAAIQAAHIERCDEKGFDAVEFDNLDSWTRAKLDSMTKRDNLDLARRLVTVATDAGLASGQKNTTQFGKDGRDVAGFTFAIAEECDRWKECGAYTKVYGDQVIDIEYAGHLRRGSTFADVCGRSSSPAMTILRDRNLVTPSKSKYVYKACEINR